MAALYGEMLLYSCLGRGNYGSSLWGEVSMGRGYYTAVWGGVTMAALFRER